MPNPELSATHGGGATPNLSSGCEALDSLLFGDALQRRTNGFTPGEVVLIRGEPGSGKTTLAFQIASNIVKANPEAMALFVCVEEEPAALRKKQERYGFYSSQGMRIEWIGRSAVQKWLRKAAGSKLRRMLTPAAGLSASLALLLSTIPGFPAGGTATAATAIASLLTRITTFIRAVCAIFKRTKTEPPALLVIDSLSAFMNLLEENFPEKHPRVLFGAFCDALRSIAPGAAQPPVILLTGEHHFGQLDVPRDLPESFFCDTEIVLTTEPVRAPGNAVSSNRFALGYDVAALLGNRAKSVESRSFCRVLKSRGAPNQSRRCAYDIEEGQGVRFYETYPGDGKLILFAENEQQRQIWKSFQVRDVTDAYPALRLETFTMSGLQSVYESTRRLHNIPLRTDMALCTLDSYWVIGHRDYRLKMLINERFRAAIDRHRDRGAQRAIVDKNTLMQVLPRDDKPLPRGRCAASELACAEYPLLINDALHYALQRLERNLCTSTKRSLAELARGGAARNQRLQTRIEQLGCALEGLEAEFVQRYERTAKFLFGGNLARILDEVSSDLTLHDTFLRPLPRSKIALLGQYDGDLLTTLTREDMHEYRDGEDYWLSVPYDANVGIFVVRQDLLDHLLTDQSPDAGAGATGLSRDGEQIKRDFVEHFQRLKRREIEVLELLKEQPILGSCTEVLELEELAQQRIDEAKRQFEDKHVWERLGPRLPRYSWDQVICLTAVSGYGFEADTRNFDTLVAFFLELIWNAGGALHVDARYRIENKPCQLVAMARALHYFSALVEFTPRRTKATPDRKGSDGAACDEWLFGRMWYSALLDRLTARAGRALRGFGGAPPGKRPHIEIVRMPAGVDAPSPPHFACWGDWNFALLAGSENVTLACDLVSNLMGTLKVTERALRGAGLPTARMFYEQYGATPCVPPSIRGDVDLPSMTFGALRENYLEPSGTRDNGGIFRQSIFDYRHCAREIYAVLLRVQQSARTPSSITAETLVQGVVEMVERVEALRSRYMFIGDSFRHDTLRTSEQVQKTWRRRKQSRLLTPDSCTAVASESTVRLFDISLGGCRIGLPLYPVAELRHIEIGQRRLELVPPQPQHCRRPSDTVGLQFAQGLSPPEFRTLVKALAHTA